MTPSLQQMLNKAASEVVAAADSSRSQLTAAVALMMKNGYKPIRADQFEKDGVLVEVGYVYGESRLTVHCKQDDHGLVEDIRLTGRDLSQFARFKELIGV